DTLALASHGSLPRGGTHDPTSTGLKRYDRLPLGPRERPNHHELRQRRRFRRQRDERAKAHDGERTTRVGQVETDVGEGPVHLFKDRLALSSLEDRRDHDL